MHRRFGRRGVSPLSEHHDQRNASDADNRQPAKEVYIGKERRLPNHVAVENARGHRPGLRRQDSMKRMRDPRQRGLVRSIARRHSRRGLNSSSRRQERSREDWRPSSPPRPCAASTDHCSSTTRCYWGVDTTNSRCDRRGRWPRHSHWPRRQNSQSPVP